MHAEGASVDSQTRGGADVHNSSGLFWYHAGVDAKHSCARVSSLARGDWVERPLEFDDQPPYPNSQSQPLIEMMAAARKVALNTDRRILVST